MAGRGRWDATEAQSSRPCFAQACAHACTMPRTTGPGTAEHVFVAICDVARRGPSNPSDTPQSRWYSRRPAAPEGTGGLLFIVVVPALKGPLPAVVTPDLAPTWQRITEELQRAVPESTFEIWLAPLRAVSLDAAHLTVSAPPELRAWVSERFGRLLQACAAVHLGPGATVDVVDV